MPTLSSRDLHRLTIFKWVYTLEARGFTRPEAERLIFLRWLFTTRYYRLTEIEAPQGRRASGGPRV